MMEGLKKACGSARVEEIEPPRAPPTPPVVWAPCSRCNSCWLIQYCWPLNRIGTMAVNAAKFGSAFGTLPCWAGPVTVTAEFSGMVAAGLVSSMLANTGAPLVTPACGQGMTFANHCENAPWLDCAW